DPSIVGISAGAALFASLTIVLGGSFFSATWLGVSALSFASFTGAVLATILVFTISQEKRGTNVSTMLLAGIAINSLAGACMGVLTYLADDAQLRSLTFWTLGSLGGSNWLSVTILALVTVSSVIFLSRLYKPFNALALGEREAVNLGISVEKLKIQVVAFTALSIGSAVAFCGMIGFVGLVVPHILRLFGGSDHRFLLPASALGGALLLGLADTASRTVASPAELPIGIITSLVGAPIFLWLIYRKR
ncbi:MAG: iron complex transport system permease protein, partial [Arenicella sp.]